MNILEIENPKIVQAEKQRSEDYVRFYTGNEKIEVGTGRLIDAAYYIENDNENMQGKVKGSPATNWLRIQNTNWTITENCFIEIELENKTFKSELVLENNAKEIKGTSYLQINNKGAYGYIEKIKIYKDDWVADIFTTTTTAVTEFAESVSTSVSAVGGMFYQGGQMTFLGTLSLLTAGTLLVMWAVRTIRRLIGR